MFLIWIFVVLIYLLFNLMITIAWTSDNADIKHKGIIALVLMVAGLPIMIIVIIISIVLGVVEVSKKK